MAKPNEHYRTKLSAIVSNDELCKFAKPLIQAKARKLVRKSGFRPDELDEIEQEVTLRLLERFATSAASDCPVMVFIQKVVEQSISNQIRDRLAQKRDPRGVRSLNTGFGGTDKDGELRDVVGQIHVDGRRGNLSFVAQEIVEMGIDTDEVIAQLPQDLQDLCRALGDVSVAELARRLEQPRTTLQDQVRTIRGHLEDTGLRDYLR